MRGLGEPMPAHMGNPHPDPKVRPSSYGLVLTPATSFCLCSQNLAHLFSSLLSMTDQEVSLVTSEMEKHTMSGNSLLTVLSRGVVLESLDPCPIKYHIS